MVTFQLFAMIETALLLLKNELQSYISTRDASVTVVVDNIGLVETSKGDTLTNNIVLTLVNIEEESTLKNSAALRRPFTSQAEYQNPPIFLNLYVLFTCNYSGDDYRLALRRLAHIIRFLQSRNSFSVSSAVTGDSFDFADEEVSSLKFTLEMFTLSFEQINHLWGSLGGRQMPFVMYKLRLVSITEHARLREVPLIEEIEATARPVSNP
jgi:Pvc16 N-terminal domain